GQGGPRDRRCAAAAADPDRDAAGDGRVPDLLARAAPERPRRLGRPLPPQGGADPPRQCGDHPEPRQRGAVQGNRGSVTSHVGWRGTMPLGGDQSDEEALAAEGGLALEADAANAGQSAPADSAAEGTEAAASQWAAMVDDGSSFMPAAKGGAERILNQEEI